MKLTADTITDEQIVALRNASLRAGDLETAGVCDDALSSTIARYDPAMSKRCRMRCAVVLNNRSGVL